MRSIYAIALLIVIYAHPVHADPLQDRIESAIEAFGGIIPHAPDVGLGWADMVIRGAVDQANPSTIISSDKIGDWLLANQPSGIDAQYKQRAEWVASAFKTVMQPNTKFVIAHPAEQISVADLNLRIVAAVDKVTPGPSKAELTAEVERLGNAGAEDMRERQEKREADEWLRKKMEVGK